MKRSKIYPFLLSALLLSACSDEEPSPTPIPGGEEAFATVSVAVDGVAKTKTKTTHLGTEEENDIKNLTVVFIDEQHNEVIAHGFREIGTDNMDTTARVGLKTGTYKMLLLANTEKIASFKPSDYYDGIIASLEEQGGGNGFVMTNILQDVEIVAGENKIGANNPIKIKRLVGRIDFSKLTVDFKYNKGESTEKKDSDLQNIDGLKFRLKRIFLANVRPTSYLFDTSGWNLPEGQEHPIEITTERYLRGIENGTFYAGEDSEIAEESDYAAYLDVKKEPVIEILEDQSAENVASFYAMTNLTSEKGDYPVILYIKGDLCDGTGNPVLTNRYFRIRLAKGVERNTLYQISATIQGKGSPEPGDNKENIDLSVTILVKTWNNVILDTITIDHEIEIE